MMGMLLEYGPWGAVVCVVWLGLRFIRIERKRADVIVTNHLQHTYQDHEKITERLEKLGELLQEMVFRLRQMNERT